MTVTVKTDKKWKNFKYRNEVPKKVLADNFSWTNEEDQFDNFFQYKGYWYHLDDFMNLAGFEPMKGWDGYSGDSFFSGVVIKVSPDGEQYQVGTYYS